MVTDLFTSLLQELGKLLKIKSLQPDQNNTCLIRFPNQPSIQIELDRSGNFIMLGSDIASIPAGHYRETVFREALKANGTMPPRHGDFAYSQKSDRLVLIEHIPVKDLNGDKLHQALIPFLEKAKYWQEAINHGDTPTGAQITSSGKIGMFGLR